MEICPSCRSSFSDGTLCDVYLEKGGQITHQVLCRECGLEATRGMHAVEIKKGAQGVGKSRKWWEFWK